MRFLTKKMAAVSSLIAFITAVQYLIVYVLYEEATSHSNSNHLMGVTGSLDATRLPDKWWNSDGRTRVTANMLTAALDHTVHYTVVRNTISTVQLHEQHLSDVIGIERRQVASESGRASDALKHALGIGDVKYRVIGAPTHVPDQVNLHSNVEQQLKVATADELHSVEGNHPLGKSQALFRSSVVERNDGPSETLEANSEEPHEFFKRYLRLREQRKRGGSTLAPRGSEHSHLEDIRLPSQPQPRVRSIDDNDRQRNLALQRTRIAVNRPEGKSMKPTIGNVLMYLMELCQEKLEPLVECSDRVTRNLTPFEQDGKNIMFTLRTTLAYHKQRLPLLFETWLSTVTPSTVFIVTDGHHMEMEKEISNRGMHYVIAQSGSTHLRSDLCCKAGVELELLFKPENSHADWLCHVDDDIYIHLKVLVRTLAVFDPKTEPIYFGRAGSEWGRARQVSENSTIGRPGQRYHFAVGGMYCLSRAMLEMAKPYLIGCDAFGESCSKAQEPEDVTVGLIIGVVLKQSLSRTEMIYTHGLDLISTAPSPFLRDQVAFSYGYGSLKPWSFMPNVVYVPGALYNVDEDETQFRSLHCFLYPMVQTCKDKRKALVQLRMEKKMGKRVCICSWESLFCCKRYINATRNMMMNSN